MTAKSDKTSDIYAVLLVGGKGERFWPLSTPEKPKQFLRIFSGITMVEETVERISSLIPKRNIFFVLPPHLENLLKKTVKGIRTANIVVEPEGRNTAPAIALAAKTLSSKPDAVMAVLPADHLISPTKTFLADIKAGADLANKRFLVTFGIPPDRPETGYGYIEVDERGNLGNRGYKVKKFREKPDLKTAKKYLKSGNFYWNSGIFVWRVKDIIDAFKLNHSGIYKGLLNTKVLSKPPTKKDYTKLEATSIDYAIMEKASNVAVLPAKFKWDDVGSWTAIERHLSKGLDKNTRIGKLIQLDSVGCITVADEGEIALLGVRDLIVVKSKDTVFICAKDRAAEVKKLLAKKALKKR